MEASSDVPIPVYASITSSGDTCSRSGRPPFVVTITYKCTVDVPILALYRTYAERGNGCEIRDPRRNSRRRGPSNRYHEDESLTEIDFTEMVRMTPGEELVRTYKFITEDDSDTLFNNDIHNLELGNEYELGIQRQKWWYVAEEQVRKDATTDDIKRLLYERGAIEWEPIAALSFQLIE